MAKTQEQKDAEKAAKLAAKEEKAKKKAEAKAAKLAAGDNSPDDDADDDSGDEPETDEEPEMLKVFLRESFSHVIDGKRVVGTKEKIVVSMSRAEYEANEHKLELVP